MRCNEQFVNDSYTKSTCILERDEYYLHYGYWSWWKNVGVERIEWTRNVGVCCLQSTHFLDKQLTLNRPENEDLRDEPKLTIIKCWYRSISMSITSHLLFFRFFICLIRFQRTLSYHKFALLFSSFPVSRSINAMNDW